jgi:type IV secretion system protein VirD4
MLSWTILLLGVGLIVVDSLYLPVVPWELSSAAILLIACAGGGYFNKPRVVRVRRPWFGGMRQVEAAITKVHGDQRWATTREMIEAFPGPKGLVVGEASAIDPEKCIDQKFLPHDKGTWGDGGKSRLLIDRLTELSTHSILYGASGFYKSMSAATAIHEWPWSGIAFDPKLELEEMLREPLEGKGRRVFALGLGTKGINAIGWFDKDHPEAEDHINTIVETIYDDGAAKASAAQFPSKDMSFWIQWGKALTGCLLAHMLWSDDDRPNTLAGLREAVRTSERKMIGLLRTINAESKSPMARDTAGGLMEMRADETFSGIYANAFSGTKWLQVKAYADLVSDNGFNPRDLLDGETFLFVKIPLRTMRSTPQLAKTVLGSILNTIYMAEPEDIVGRIFAYIDEAKRFGAMTEIEEAFDVGRSARITMQLIYQAESQLEQVWGKEGASTIRENCSWIGYSPVQDHSLAKQLSDAIGQRGVMTRSQGNNAGTQQNRGSWFSSRSSGDNFTEGETGIPLIRPEVLRRLPGDSLIVLTRHCPWPILCRKAIYFRRRDLAKSIKSSRFAKQVA